MTTPLHSSVAPLWPLFSLLNPESQHWTPADWHALLGTALGTSQDNVAHAAWAPLFTMSRAGQVLEVTPLLEPTLGYGPELVGQHVRQLLYSSLEVMRLQLLHHALDAQGKTEIELVMRHISGEIRHLLIRLMPSPTGPEGLLVACLWPEAQFARRKLLSGQRNFMHFVLDSLPAPMVILDTERRYVYCNPQAIRSEEIRRWIIGHTDEEYVAYRGFDPAMAQRRHEYLELAIREKKTVSFEEVFYPPGQDRVLQLRTYTPVFSDAGELVYVVGYGLEITELRRAQQELQLLNDDLEARVQARTRQLQEMTERLQYDAFHDSLTGLPNRALLYDRLQQALYRARKQNGQYAVLYLDTDRFKSINDTLGHPAGDALLIELASRLRQSVRASDTVARLSGDEFMVLVEPISVQEDVLQIASRIQQELRRPIQVAGLEVSISVSIGIVFCCVPGLETAVDILRDADIAMYRAKAAGRDGYVVFEPEMREQAIRQSLLANDLRLALEREELAVAYQPIVRLSTGLVAGFEALVRWPHPESGFISPADFVPVAEESGLLLEIDRWVLRRACTDMVEQQRLSPLSPPLSLSVNFSARHFAGSDIYSEIEKTLAQTGFRAELLHIEITESALLGRPQTVGHTLERLRSLGVKLHIDDFGTGYSSLSYLHTYPLDTLKIDRSFVQDMTTQASSAELVKTITVMAQNMDMEVVAEGIETPQQLQRLLELGCTYGQGFLLARPLPIAQAWAIATSGTPLPAP